MGGISAGASAEALDALTRCGDALGLAYQIADDLLDVEQTAEALGKRTGKDADRGKLTYPGVLGVEASRAELDRLHDEAIEALTPLGAPAEALRELCRTLRRRDR
jgi:geranylgeranyl diphosphate synthase type II